MFRARVENNKDPENLQRVQVRVLGKHNFDELDLPSDILPWAEPAPSLLVGKVDGGYGEFDVPDIGDWVWVFFEGFDDAFLFPVYFATIRGNKDKNPNYKQGENKVIADRWNNVTVFDNESYKKTDTWGNNIQISETIMSLLDHFKNNIHLDEEKIIITSKNGNSLLLDSKNEKIEVKTNKGASVLIDDKNDLLQVTVGKSQFDMDKDGQIYILSKDGKNETIDFYKFMILFNTHTHTSSFPSSPTSPPTMPMDSMQHVFGSVSYLGRMPMNNMKIDESSDYDAQNDPAGTQYDKDSISPTSPIADDNTVTSTVLKNNSVNPSTDEYEGTLNYPSLPPKYTGEVIAHAPYYVAGKKTEDGNLVKIQNKIVDEDVAKILYKMIKDSQIYNMVENLKYIKYDEKKKKYYVTKKGESGLNMVNPYDKDGENYKENDEFFELNEVARKENYQNNICQYSLVVINSGFRGGVEDVKHIKTGENLCTTQLSIRKRNQRRRMTDDELLNASSKEFSPFTAKPRYSKHECGVAVDLNTKGAGQNDWLTKNASKYGLKRTIPSELWHFELKK
jgi:hypothetical protein